MKLELRKEVDTKGHTYWYIYKDDRYIDCVATDLGRAGDYDKYEAKAILEFDKYVSTVNKPPIPPVTIKTVELP